jgi:hypothetical protein
LNIRRTSLLSENICPGVLFSGIKVDFKKELNLSFGDYVEAYKSTDNTSAARSAACIALYPITNAASSWILWKLETNCNVQGTRFVKLVTTEAVINKVNRIAEAWQRRQGNERNKKETSGIPILQYGNGNTSISLNRRFPN